MFATIESIRSRKSATIAEKSLSSRRSSQRDDGKTHVETRRNESSQSLTSFNPIGTPRAEGKRRRSDL